MNPISLPGEAPKQANVSSLDNHGLTPSCDGGNRGEILDEREGKPSASAMDRIIHCPGCLAAECGKPELPQTDGTTDTGTRVHAALETGNSEDLGLSELEIKERITDMEQRALADWKQAVEEKTI